MPVISMFLGVAIRVFHADHPPPHVHVQYGEFQAVVDIATGKVLGGRLPKRVARLVNEWLRLRRRDIMKSWLDAQAMRVPRRVRPLQ